MAATVEVGGDSAGVEAWAARGPGGRVGVLVWNGTLDHARADGADDLARSVVLHVDGLLRTAAPPDR